MSGWLRGRSGRIIAGQDDVMQTLVKLLKKIAAQCVTGLMRSGRSHLAMLLLRAEHSLSLKRRRQRLLKLSTVSRGAVDLSAITLEVFPPRPVKIPPVRRFGVEVSSNDVGQSEHTVMLPPLEITLFRGVKVIGGSEMLFATGGRLLYDELALGDPNRYGCKAFGIIPAQAFGLHLPAVRDGCVLVTHSAPDSAPISRAIHLCKDHSCNYFHWLFECLPRAIVALEKPEYEGWPLLVDAGVPAQSFQALQRLCGSREIIRIGHREVCAVDELVFPGVFSFMRDNYGRQVAVEDLVVAPEAVKLLRDRLLPAVKRKAGRKLYVARDRARYRRMLNEQQIQGRLLEQGFEIVRPEELSFVEQLDLFSEAAAIIGPTGAGLSNMVFAPPGCKVIVLAGATHHANFLIFGQLGSLLEHELMYVTGDAKRPWIMHSDYSIDLRQFDDAMVACGLAQQPPSQRDAQ